MNRPPWLDWELELSPHLEKRMLDRRFTEVDLRAMLEHVRDVRPSPVEGRHVLLCPHGGRSWSVVVEPDEEASVLVVVTAYPMEPSR
jgi:hypothetical protein